MKLISNETEAVDAVRKLLGKTGENRDRNRSDDVASNVAVYSQHQQVPNVIQGHHDHVIAHHDHVSSHNDLQKSAEEILAGVKRPTGVETNIVSHYVSQGEHIFTGWNKEY